MYNGFYLWRAAAQETLVGVFGSSWIRVECVNELLQLWCVVWNQFLVFWPWFVVAASGRISRVWIACFVSWSLYQYYCYCLCLVDQSNYFTHLDYRLAWSIQFCEIGLPWNICRGFLWSSKSNRAASFGQLLNYIFVLSSRASIYTYIHTKLLVCLWINLLYPALLYCLAEEIKSSGIGHNIYIACFLLMLNGSFLSVAVLSPCLVFHD